MAYWESVKHLDLTGSTPYNIVGGDMHCDDMHALFHRCTQLRSVKWTGGKISRCSSDDNSTQLRYVLDLNLREDHEISDCYIWSTPPCIPNWAIKCGLRERDIVSYRIRYSPADWLFHPEGLARVEAFISGGVDIDVLAVEDHNTAHLPRMLTLLQSIGESGRPKLIRFTGLRLDNPSRKRNAASTRSRNCAGA